MSRSLWINGLGFEEEDGENKILDFFVFDYIYICMKLQKHTIISFVIIR